MTAPGRLRRRTLLRAAAAGAAAATAGCAGGGRGVQVAVVWSGGELAPFRAVVARYGSPVHVVSAGNDIDAFLRARQLAGTSPDVAILPGPASSPSTRGGAGSARSPRRPATASPTASPPCSTAAGGATASG